MFTIMQKFSDWLISAMNERGWNQAALARAAGLTPTAISNLITGKRNPGIDSCIPIANALKLPAETVLLAAGLIEQEPDKDERLYKIENLYHTLKEDNNKDRALQFLEFLSGLEDKNDRTGKKSK